MEINFDKALVTGGAGFIGSHIVEYLVEKKCGITVLDNLSTGHYTNIEHFKNKMTFVKGDIQDTELLLKCASGCDVIFHLAAVVSVTQTVEEPLASAMVNDIGTLKVLDAARQKNVKRVVFSSSCAVYGDDPELPKSEEMNLKPMSPYAVQKLSGEHNASVYHKLFGLEAVCLRYFNVYGPRQDPSSPYSGVISIFMTKVADQSQPNIYGDGNQYRDFVFVKDVVKANMLAATAKEAGGRVFNIGTGGHVTINELWRTICRMDGSVISPIYLPGRPGDIVESVADIGQAGKQLGYAPDYSFTKGIDLTYNWYKQNR